MAPRPVVISDSALKGPKSFGTSQAGLLVTATHGRQGGGEHEEHGDGDKEHMPGAGKVEDFTTPSARVKVRVLITWWKRRCSSRSRCRARPSSRSSRARGR